MALSPRSDDENRKDQLEQKAKNFGNFNHLSPEERAKAEAKKQDAEAKK